MGVLITLILASRKQRDFGNAAFDRRKGFPLISSRFIKSLSLLKPSYLPPLKFVDIVRVSQMALSGVSVFAINIDEDVGVGPSAEHVASKDTHFVGVDCQTIEGINYQHLLILSHISPRKLYQIRSCTFTTPILRDDHEHIYHLHIKCFIHMGTTRK